MTTSSTGSKLNDRLFGYGVVALSICIMLAIVLPVAIVVPRGEYHSGRRVKPSMSNASDTSTTNNTNVTNVIVGTPTTPPQTIPNVSPSLSPTMVAPTMSPTEPPATTSTTALPTKGATTTIMPTTTETASKTTIMPTTTTTTAVTNLTNATVQELLWGYVSGQPADKNYTNDTSPQGQAFDWILNTDEISDLQGNSQLLVQDLEISRDILMQRYILAVFYFAMGGPTEWEPSARRNFLKRRKKECGWDMITCGRGESVGVILAVDNDDNRGVAGHLPREFGYLSGLESLVLTNADGIEGTLPETIYQLDSLRRLEITDTLLNGTISSAVGNLANLETLLLSDNQLSGSIPVTVYELPKLETIDLQRNNLEGSLSTAIGNLTTIQSIRYSQNDMRGPIPTQLAQLSTLEDFACGSCGLTGTIPTILGTMTSLTSLRLGANSLFGPIPPELGNMTSLENIRLGNNSLTGTIPPSLGDWQNAQFVYLKNNSLTGVMPEAICQLVDDKQVVALTADCIVEVNCTCCTECYLDCPSDDSNTTCFEDLTDEVLPP